MRAVLNRPSKLRITTEDDTGTVFDLDAPPAVTFRDLDGASVITGTMTRTALGKYEFPFSRNSLAPLTASWVGAAAGLDIEGAEEVRMVDRRSLKLSTLRTDSALTAVDPADLVELLDGAENALEDALRFSIVTTMDRVKVAITKPQRVLRLPQPSNYLQSVVAGTWQRFLGGPEVIIDPASIVARGDALELPYGRSWDFLTGGTPSITWLPGWYSFDIVRGITETPIDIQKAVRMLVRHFATQDGPNQYPDRASKIMSADTEIWFSRGGPDAYFGIPEVDAVITQRRLDIPFADNPTF